MAVKVLGADASGDMATVAAGVRYAVAHGARVINLSLTGPSPGTDLAAAVAAVDEQRLFRMREHVDEPRRYGLALRIDLRAAMSGRVRTNIDDAIFVNGHIAHERRASQPS